MTFDSRDKALAAGLKGNASRSPDKASSIARAAALARWAGHEKVSTSYPLLKGAELDHWVAQIPPTVRESLTRGQLVRRATLLARSAAAQAAVEVVNPPTNDGLALLRAEQAKRRGEQP